MSKDVYQNTQVAGMLASAQAEIIQGAITHVMFWGEKGRDKFLSMCDEAFSTAVGTVAQLKGVLDENDVKVAAAAKKGTP